MASVPIEDKPSVQANGGRRPSRLIKSASTTSMALVATPPRAQTEHELSEPATTVISKLPRDIQHRLMHIAEQQRQRRLPVFATSRDSGRMSASFLSLNHSDPSKSITSPAADGPTPTEYAKTIRHEKMVERFQVRRLTTRDLPVYVDDSQYSEHQEPPLSDGDLSDTQDDIQDGDIKQCSVEHSDNSKRHLISLATDLRRTMSLNSTFREKQASTADRRDNESDVTAPVFGQRHSAVIHSVRREPSVRFSLRRKLTRWRRTLWRTIRQTARCMLSPISPLSTSALVRNAILVVAFAVYIVDYPMSLAFGCHDTSWTGTTHSAVEITFLVDFLLMFNTSFVNDDNEIVTSRREIIKNYITGWFLFDLISSIPAHLLFAGAHKCDNQRSTGSVSYENVVFILRFERLVHVLKAAHFFWFARLDRTGKGFLAWLKYSRYSHLFRISWILLFIALVAHYVGCGWKMLGGRHSDPSSSFAEEYAMNYYDALQLLQGQGVATSTTAQSVFASFAMLLGSIVLAIIFGHVAVLVSNFNANSTNYQRKMESVFAIMTKMQLPAPLRERIHQYYEHLWREYESLDGEIERFSKNLSHTLELEVVLFKYMELVMGVPFWKNCSPDFQKQLMLSLQIRVYLPDDFIMRRGEVDEEFYMINQGSVELATGPDSFERAIVDLIASTGDPGSAVSTTSKIASPVKSEQESRRGDHQFDLHDLATRPHRLSRQQNSKKSLYRIQDYHVDVADDDAVRSAKQRSFRLKSSGVPLGDKLQHLSKGQAFGEMALVMNYQRTANARAITHVELCVLSRTDFQLILVKHPEDRKKVMSAMLGGCMVYNESNSVFCPLKEMVQSVYGGDGTSESQTSAASIRADEAASLIMDVINPEKNDTSIRFGVNSGLRQLLVEKRDRDKQLRDRRTVTDDCDERATHTAKGIDPSTSLNPGLRNSPHEAQSASEPDNAGMQNSQAAMFEMMFSLKAAMDQLQVQVNAIADATSALGMAANSLASQVQKLPTVDTNFDSVTEVPKSDASNATTTSRSRPLERNSLPRPKYLKTRSESGVALIGQRKSGALPSFDAPHPRLSPLRRMRSFIPFTSEPTALTSQTPFADQLFQRRHDSQTAMTRRESETTAPTTAASAVDVPRAVFPGQLSHHLSWRSLTKNPPT